jgi:hypothetical protein
VALLLMVLDQLVKVIKHSSIKLPFLLHILRIGTLYAKARYEICSLLLKCWVQSIPRRRTEGSHATSG